MRVRIHGRWMNQNPILVRMRVLSASLLPWCLACATVNGVLQEPIPRGRAYRYTTAPDTVAAAAAGAFAAQGLSLARDTMVGPTRLLVGKSGVTLMSWGRIDRAAITPTAEGAEVRMISRSIGTLGFFARDRSPRLFQVLDRELGGTGLQPLAGDRVRLVLLGPQRRTLTGTVLPTVDGAASLALEAEGRAQVIPADDLARISLSRGSYGHGPEGAFIGFILGSITGLVLAGNGDSGDWGGVEEHGVGVVIGGLVGAVTGGLTGAAIRTEVWSDISPERLGRQTERPHAQAPSRTSWLMQSASTSTASSRPSQP